MKTYLKHNKSSSKSKKYFINSNYFNTSESKIKIKQKRLYTSRKNSFNSSKNKNIFSKTQNSFDNFSKTENEVLLNSEINNKQYNDLVKNTYSFLTELNNHKIKNVESYSEMQKKTKKIDGVSFEYRDYSKIKNADILKKFQKNKQMDNSENDRLLENKRKKIKLKESGLQFINKVSWMKLNNYAYNMKKEICLRVQETKQNNLDYLKDKIQSIKYIQTICGSKFATKIGNYIKYLNMKKDSEIGICLQLIRKINNLKNEIKDINSKIKKKENEKDYILKWVYLQIKMDQQKNTLPLYYKTVLNNFLIIELLINQKLKTIHNSDGKEDIKKYIKKFSIDMNYNLNIEKLSSEIKDFLSRENCVSEFNYIKDHYKNNLPFKTEGKFQEKMLYYENEDLQLITLNSQLNTEIIYLQKELNIILQKKNEDESSNNALIISKENELSHVKFFYQNNYNLIKKLKNNKKINMISNNNELGINNNKVNKIFNKLPLNNKVLLNKINVSYEICSKFNKKEKIIDIFTKNEAQYLKEKGILFKLLLIEIVVDYLVGKLQNYHKIFDEKIIKKLWADIDKIHKDEKTEEQKKEQRKKAERLKFEIEKKNNKIYFLPHKKFDMFSIAGRKKTKIKIEDDSNKIPDFEDFIFEGGEN